MDWIKKLLNGFEQPFLGLNLLRREKRLRGYVMIPVAINIAVFLLLLALLWIFRVDLIEVFYVYPDEGFWKIALWYLVGVVIFVFIVVLTYFLFTPIGCLLASPFNDALAGRAEQVFEDAPVIVEVPFMWRALPKMLAKETVKLLLALGVAVVALGMNLLPVVGSVLSVAFTATFGSFVFALEYLDYPMSRYNYRLSDVISAIRANLWRSLGFGGAALLLLLIPLVNLVCIPACVVGGTHLFVDYRREGLLPAPPILPVGSDETKQ
jgi:CysZ protein